MRSGMIVHPSILALVQPVLGDTVTLPSQILLQYTCALPLQTCKQKQWGSCICCLNLN